MRRLSAFLAGILALVGVVSVWSSVAQAPIEIANQAWVNRRPTSLKDQVNWLLVVRSADGRYGAAQRSSAYRYAGERFRWTKQGHRFTMTFPQSDRQVTLRARAYACKKAYFDRCLDLERDGRKITLYSRKEWKLPQAEDAMVPPAGRAPVVGACRECTDVPPSALQGLFD